MSTDLSGVYARDITDTSGALHILAERSGKNFSPDMLHYLVREGTLSAFVFHQASLVPWSPEHKRRGQTLIFLKSDLYTLKLSEKKRGRGAEKQLPNVAEIGT